jgi:hypothetical protein
MVISGAAASGSNFLTRTRAIVLAIEQKSAEPPDPAVVRDILGLTLGEARVASLVGSDLPPRADFWSVTTPAPVARW